MSGHRDLSLAVADVGWFTTENLFREAPGLGVRTLLLKCLDYRNAWNQRVPFRRWRSVERLEAERLHRRDLILPPGWMKRFPRWGMRPIAQAVRGWRRRHAPESSLALVMTYPHYLYLRDQVRPDVSVYFNLDDYALYWPQNAEAVRALEVRAVRESDLTVCVSEHRRRELARLVPEAADRIHHLPHGYPGPPMLSGSSDARLDPPEDLKRFPKPWLGFIGSLEDRVDWDLLANLADAMPQASILLIGRLPESAAPWAESRARCLARPNVHHLGWRPQEAVIRCNAAFDVGLIPYQTDHPFNIACSPTKIMDLMGVGRPIVATDLPECRLYADLFDIADADDPADFAAKVRANLETGDAERSARRLAWAADHTCRRQMERFWERVRDGRRSG